MKIKHSQLWHSQSYFLSENIYDFLITSPSRQIFIHFGRKWTSNNNYRFLGQRSSVFLHYDDGVTGNVLPLTTRTDSGLDVSVKEDFP
jgi:hypothetical protein